MIRPKPPMTPIENDWKNPNGFPITTACCPTFGAVESNSRGEMSDVLIPSILITARSLALSAPTSRPLNVCLVLSGLRTVTLAMTDPGWGLESFREVCRTCQFVMTFPSRSNTTPVPLPSGVSGLPPPPPIPRSLMSMMDTTPYRLLS